MAEWSLITSHGLVLAAISRNPQKTTREIADDVGITERRAHKLITDLDVAGYIKKIKMGKRNVYKIDSDAKLVDRLADASIGDMLALFGWQKHTGPRKDIDSE
jgi:predicted transcriptional regulator